ncbi:hypothetical protein DSO57_1008043 [Entomophthora muscae]|uniref:Uncharacterized protein n=1 Tax=Entomophthora muscae TaxID=34485 RepID=A0ACC2RLW5_9FUNG|nr:hypothetical protein DSO57_1008043 [Entomophthora muscae]
MEDHVKSWSIDQVGTWLSSKGFDSFRRTFKEQEIYGDVLIALDHEHLIELQMNSVGKRVLFLKAIYELKVRYNIPIYPDDYQPPPAQETTSIQDELFGAYSIQDPKIIAAFKERDAVIRHLVQEVSRLSSEIGKLRDEIRWVSQPKNDKAAILSNQSTKNFKNRPSPILTNSPKSAVANPSALSTRPPLSPSVSQEKSTHSSPRSPNPLDQPMSSSTVYSLENAAFSSSEYNSSSDMVKVKDLKGQQENEAYKSFRISPEDPCSKVILAALKKYKISDHWQNYSLYITQASGEELKLGMDDLPLLIYQKLKEANTSPMFTIKHNIKGKIFPFSSNNGAESKGYVSNHDNHLSSKGVMTPTSNQFSPKVSA